MYMPEQCSFTLFLSSNLGPVHLPSLTSQQKYAPVTFLTRTDWMPQLPVLSNVHFACEMATLHVARRLEIKLAFFFDIGMVFWNKLFLKRCHCSSVYCGWETLWVFISRKPAVPQTSFWAASKGKVRDFEHISTPGCSAKLGASGLPSVVGNTRTMAQSLIQPHLKEAPLSCNWSANIHSLAVPLNVLCPAINKMFTGGFRILPRTKTVHTALSRLIILALAAQSQVTINLKIKNFGEVCIRPRVRVTFSIERHHLFYLLYEQEHK